MPGLTKTAALLSHGLMALAIVVGRQFTSDPLFYLHRVR